jgi:hypothetical protein
MIPDTNPCLYRIGNTDSSEAHRKGREDFEQALATADLVIDATAERLAHYYLCHQLRGTTPSLILTTRPVWDGTLALKGRVGSASCTPIRAGLNPAGAKASTDGDQITTFCPAISI